MEPLLAQSFDIPEEIAIWLQPTVRLLLILIIWWLLHRLVRLLIGRFEKRLLTAADLHGETAYEARKRVDTLVGLLRQVVNIFLFVILALVVLMQLGVQVGPLIAGAGIIGVAVGFGAQYLVRDIITGFFMVLENQIRVGDVVTINGQGGLVEALTLRTVVLRDGGGVVHVFPHGVVTTLSNSTRGWSAYLFNIAVSYREDPDHAITVIRRVALEMRRDEPFKHHIITDPEIFGVDKLDAAGMMIQGRIRTRPGMQADVGREFLRRLKKAFDIEAIEFPSAPTTLYLTGPQPAPDKAPIVR